MKLIFKILILVIIIFVAVAGYFGYNTFINSIGLKNTEVNVTLPDNPLPPDYNRLKDVLQDNEIIKKLPSDAVLSLRFFSFLNGERIWEKEFVLKRNYADGGEAKNPDITIILHSKYANIIESNNFCGVVRLAKANDDISFETNLSTIALAWKYKSLLGYRSCFGI
jgi:hypothetical protein